MENHRLTRDRVYHLIRSYASKNGGDIPSSSGIVIQNGGYGSLSSANLHRRMYIEEHKSSAEEKSPLEGLPSAVSDAIGGIRESLSAESKKAVDQVNTERENDKKEYEQVIANLEKQLLEKSDANNTLASEYSGLREANSTLSGKNEALTDELQACREKGVETRATFEAEFARLEGELQATANSNEQLSALFKDLNRNAVEQRKAIVQMNVQQGGFGEMLSNSNTGLASGQESIEENIQSVIEAVNAKNNYINDLAISSSEASAKLSLLKTANHKQEQQLQATNKSLAVLAAENKNYRATILGLKKECGELKSQKQANLQQSIEDLSEMIRVSTRQNQA